MGSSPIARSIIFLFTFFCIPINLPAQVETDPSRPFDQGQVLFLPGTTDYLGDLPHQSKIISEGMAFHTNTGTLATQVGWTSSFDRNQIGFRKESPGILFEGISYPLASSNALNWMPQSSPIEILDFPAAAWWGPKASGGAVQFQAPVVSVKTSDQISFWGGTNWSWGAENQFQGNLLSVNGNYQHLMPMGSNGLDVFNVLSKARWVQNDSVNIESGLLAAQWVANDYWYSAFTSINIKSPNFQTIQIKPYFQTAQSEKQSVQEIGSYLNYHFTLAGLAESHFGMGFSHKDFFPNAVQMNNGFIQTTNLIDALGSLLIDMAFRVDFSTVSSTVFSTLIGLQTNQGSFTFLGDYGKGVLEETSRDTQQLDLGIRYQPNDKWSTALKYLHEQIANDAFDGGRFQIQFNHERDLLLIFKKTQVLFEEQILENSSGVLFYDTGGQIQFSLTPQNRIWIKGRGLSNQPFFCEVGANYIIGKNLKVYVSIANIDNLPVSWPDPLLPAGRVVWAGIQGQF